MIPFGAAHAYMAYIWEYSPPAPPGKFASRPYRDLGFHKDTEGNHRRQPWQVDLVYFEFLTETRDLSRRQKSPTRSQTTTELGLPVTGSANTCVRSFVKRDNGLMTTFVSFLQVSLCFQKVAAEVLGIRMTKHEIEQQSVSFEITFWWCNAPGMYID